MALLNVYSFWLWCYEENLSLYHTQAGTYFCKHFPPENMIVCWEWILFFPPVVVSLQLFTSYPIMYMSFSSFDVCLMFRMCRCKVLPLKMATHLLSQLQPRIFIALSLSRSGSSWGRGTFAELLWYSFSLLSPCPSSEFKSDKTALWNCITRRSKPIVSSAGPSSSASSDESSWSVTWDASRFLF